MQSETTPLIPKSPQRVEGGRTSQRRDEWNVFGWKTVPEPSHIKHVGRKWEDGGFVDAKIAPWDDDVSARTQLAFLLDRSMWGSLWDLVDACLNLIWVGLYIYMTTFVNKLPSSLFSADVWLAFVIFVQYLVHAFLSVEPLSALLDGLGLATFFSFLPVAMAAFTHDQNDGSYMDAGPWIFGYFVRFIRLRLISIRTFSPNHNLLEFLRFSELQRQLISTFVTVFTTLLAATSFVHIYEYKVQNLKENVSFADVFYFILISCTSGVSTKIVPDTWFSRFVIIGLMVVGATYLPPAVADLISIIRKRSVYDKPFKGHSTFLNKTEEERAHVVFCGPFNLDSLKVALREFFSEDHGAGTALTKVVLLSETEPDLPLRNILDSNLYARRVQFVKGSPVSFGDLRRAGVHTARACFILNGCKFSGRSNEEEDANVIMRALAVKRFDPRKPVFCQVALPGNKIHAEALADHTFCVQEIKYGLLAANTLAPGYATILHLLTTSVTRSVINSFEADAERDPVSFGWMKEYSRGACHEIYVIRLSSVYAGYQFTLTAELIYRVFGTVLFGLGVETDGQIQVFLNPFDYVIKGGETAYLIATEWPLAVRVAQGFGIPSNRRGSDNFVHGEVLGGRMMGDVDLEARFDQQDVHDDEYSDDEMDPEEYMLLSQKEREKVYEVRAKQRARRREAEQKERRKLKEETTVDSLGLVTDSLISKAEPMEESKTIVLGANQEVADLILPTKTTVVVNQENTTDKAGDTIEEDHDVGLGVTGVVHDSLEPSRPKTVVTLGTKTTESLENYKLGDDLPKSIQNHVIIADYSGNFPPDLEYFVGPFRERETKLGKKSTAIVFLCGKPPSADAWKKLNSFGNVYHVTGTPLSRDDMLTCNIAKAKRFVVLDDPSLKQTERTSDAKTLLSILNVEALDTNKDIFIMGCFLHNENMKLIGNTNISSSIERYGQIISSSFVSGHVYLNTMLDAWIVQTYYDKHMDQVLRALIFGSDYVLTGKAATSEDEGDQTLMYQTMQFKSIFSDTDKSYGGQFWHMASDESVDAKDDQSVAREKLSTVSCFVYRVAIPDRYIGKTYGSVFADLVRNFNAIPLALYRKVFVPRDGNPNELSPIRYSVLNPRRQKRIKQDDRVFVLAGGKPNWT